MNRKNLTTAVIAGIAGVAGIANMASAVNLNPDGLGQVLLYPYYTVNGGQQTLLSVVNTTAISKAVKVRFLEGYNSREVLDFNLFLSPFDVWTADVFALSDAGVTGATGAGIFTTDNSCTQPALSESTQGSLHYVAFRNFAYTGTNSDTGPVTDDRTREGHFEMISMADIIPGTALDKDVTHVNGVPPGCSSAEAEFESKTEITVPTSGLFGAASVVNVANGAYYAYNADALDGFTHVTLENPSGSLEPSLGDVNDVGGTPKVGPATSFVFNDGVLLTSTWPSTDVNSRSIDAVSSVFDAANIYNEYEFNADGSVGTDWVVNFPTKRFYVDAATFKLAAVVPPFEHLFGKVETGNGKGLSCVVVGISVYDREEKTTTPTSCGFSPCPPGLPPSSICRETNVITFSSASSPASILSSTLTSNIAPIGNNGGWANISFTTVAHDLPAATNGNIFHGLPVTGFEAVKFTNGNLNGVLANYAGLYRHRQSRSCTNTAACS
ncbi:MAG TPA: hypothetical protein VFB32_05150 [Rudaea sp.]|nr:hypothetical protein [Rudaea sp.]